MRVLKLTNDQSLLNFNNYFVIDQNILITRYESLLNRKEHIVKNYIKRLQNLVFNHFCQKNQIKQNFYKFFNQ